MKPSQSPIPHYLQVRDVCGFRKSFIVLFCSFANVLVCKLIFQFGKTLFSLLPIQHGRKRRGIKELLDAGERGE